MLFLSIPEFWMCSVPLTLLIKQTIRLCLRFKCINLFGFVVVL